MTTPLNISKTSNPIAVDDLTDGAWDIAATVSIDRYWSGDPAPAGRSAQVRALWSSEALHFRFDCRQAEPLVVSAEPQLAEKTIGLWDRDVCEVFIMPGSGTGGQGPEPHEPKDYFEFEAAPTGEWLDLLIHPTADGRVTDWEYRSGFSVATRIEEDRVVIAMRIPWATFGVTPRAGDVWRGNLFRCVGEGESRGYLAWQPTGTPKPNFHVPESFGKLVFRD
jgi:alpha-galactosidase